jgi:flagellum-specific peptidoglycan hydrolase FlgJ
MTRAEFIKKYAADARAVAYNSGVFPETILSAAILESSSKDKSGNWIPGYSLLARNANNFFGIKAGPSWKGRVYEIMTAEYVNGRRVMVPATFRAYQSARESFQDYVSFLKTNPRYARAGVLTAPTPELQAERLQSAGYATDPNYSKLLKSVIETVKKNLPPAAVAFTLALPLAIVFFLLINKEL